jgi:hypothetical protein
MPHRLSVSASSPFLAVGHGDRRPGWTRRTLTFFFVLERMERKTRGIGTLAHNLIAIK